MNQSDEIYRLKRTVENLKEEISMLQKLDRQFVLQISRLPHTTNKKTDFLVEIYRNKIETDELLPRLKELITEIENGKDS